MKKQQDVNDVLVIVREKLARRRFLNQHEGRRKLCVAPPPQSISLTFAEAEALVRALEDIQVGRIRPLPK